MVISKKIISIIVPCYNQAQYLNDCLQSVLDQTYANWECIIVNDGSTDITEEVAKRWVNKDARYKYVYKQNGGLSSARNKGIDICIGEYLIFLDADDIIEKEKLANQLNFLLSNPDLDLTYTSAKFFFNNNPQEFKLDKSNIGNWTKVFSSKNYEELVEEISKWNIMVVCAPMIKKSIIEFIGDFDERLKSLEDWDYWLRFLKVGGKLAHHDFDNSFSLIRVNGNSMMSNLFNMKYNELIVRLKHYYAIVYTRKPINNNIADLYKLKYCNGKVEIFKLFKLIWTSFNLKQSLILFKEVLFNMVKGKIKTLIYSK